MAKTTKAEFFKKMEKASWVEKEVCGEKFLFRQRTMKELSDFILVFSKAKSKEDAIADFLVTNICDLNKQPVFEAEDLDNMPKEIFDVFCSELCKINGLGDVSVEEASKN